MSATCVGDAEPGRGETPSLLLSRGSDYDVYPGCAESLGEIRRVIVEESRLCWGYRQIAATTGAAIPFPSNGADPDALADGPPCSMPTNPTTGAFEVSCRDRWPSAAILRTRWTRS